MGRRFILGDLHGEIGKLESVLALSGFSASRDTLYSLGDISDRGSGSAECLRRLSELPAFHAVTGNHDIWLRHYLLTGEAIPHWTEKCGGDITVKSIEEGNMSVSERLALGGWIETWPALIILEDWIIMHGGIYSGITMDDLIGFSSDKTPVPMDYADERNRLVWDRSYISSAFPSLNEGKEFAPPFVTDRNICIGHTPVRMVMHSKEYHLYAIDTSCGYKGGTLTLMDMDSLKLYQA